MGSVKLSSGMDVPNQALILPIKKSVYLKNPSIPKFKTTELAKIHFAGRFAFVLLHQSTVHKIQNCRKQHQHYIEWFSPRVKYQARNKQNKISYFSGRDKVNTKNNREKYKHEV